MVKDYVPERGDIVKFNEVQADSVVLRQSTLDFDPTLGREQAGYRPALIVTSRQFNQATRLALVCPITSHIKGFNLEVLIPDDLKTKGVILLFQLKTIDWYQRQVKLIESLPHETLEEVLAKLHALIG